MTDMDILETAGRYRVRLEIQQGSQECNPRVNDDCNLTNVITPKGQRYIDIEKDVTRIPRDAKDREDPDLDDETREWEHVDSCWGHIGREYAEEAGK